MKSDQDSSFLMPAIIVGGIALFVFAFRSRGDQQQDYRSIPAGVTPEIIAGVIADQQRGK